jgi:hypothetical protein
MSTFSRIAGSGSIRAISIAPTIVEKDGKESALFMGYGNDSVQNGPICTESLPYPGVSS